MEQIKKRKAPYIKISRQMLFIILLYSFHCTIPHLFIFTFIYFFYKDTRNFRNNIKTIKLFQARFHMKNIDQSDFLLPSIIQSQVFVPGRTIIVALRWIHPQSSFPSAVFILGKSLSQQSGGSQGMERGDECTFCWPWAWGPGPAHAGRVPLHQSRTYTT